MPLALVGFASAAAVLGAWLAATAWGVYRHTGLRTFLYFGTATAVGGATAALWAGIGLTTMIIPKLHIGLWFMYATVAGALLMVTLALLALYHGLFTEFMDLSKLQSRMNWLRGHIPEAVKVMGRGLAIQPGKAAIIGVLLLGLGMYFMFAPASQALRSVQSPYYYLPYLVGGWVAFCGAAIVFLSLAKSIWSR